MRRGSAARGPAPIRKSAVFRFPLRFPAPTCSFKAKSSARTLTGTVRGFRATSPLLRSDSLLAQVDPPFAAKTSDGTFDITMQWGELFLDLEGRPGALERLSLSGNQVRLQGKAGGMDRWTERLAMSMSFSRGTGTTMPMISCFRSTRARFRRSTVFWIRNFPLTCRSEAQYRKSIYAGRKRSRIFSKIGARRTVMSISRRRG